MKKIMMILVVGVGLLLYANGVFAATVRCEILEIKGNNVILDCGKKAVKLNVGDKVKMKTAKKAAIEGC